MLKIIKPRLCILFILMSVGILFPSYAETKYASMVVDAKTGFVFSAINQNTRNYPASLTKLMTLYLLF
ncbi:MAG: D-alanyl-D-alanine carboxypeptidase, partial [Rhodospirillales bacterium]|nr:D-alanyl-D-alanine carboxypeptidase [Rhodospirillales bacterium]